LTTAKYYTPSGRLIQREYAGLSLYDYYYSHGNNDSNGVHEVKLTDSGRTVYGGGGIAPDVKFSEPKNNRLEDTLLQHYAFFNFAKHYALEHKVGKNFEVDEPVLQAFRKFLIDQKIACTEADLASVTDWIKTRIKSEIFVDAFGQEEGLKVSAENDPEVLRALDLMGQAKQLAENAKKIMSERAAARGVNR